MKKRKFRFHDGETGAALAVRVIPRARQNEIVEVLEDNTLKIRLTAPPVEGKANKALIQFLSSILDVPKGNFEIISGSKARNKLVAVKGVDARELQKRILALIQK